MKIALAVRSFALVETDQLFALFETNDGGNSQRHACANQLRGQERSNVNRSYCGKGISDRTRRCDCRVGKRR